MIKIIGKRFKAKRPDKNGQMIMIFVYPTNYGPMSIREMEAFTGIKAFTIYTRMNRYGAMDSRVFSAEDLPHGSNQTFYKGMGRAERNPESIKLGAWEKNGNG